MFSKKLLKTSHITNLLRYNHSSVNKIYKSSEEAVKDFKDNSSVLVGGFGLCGIPENIIAALVKKGTKGMTVISNNCGVEDFGLGLLLNNKQIKRMVGSYVGENKNFEQQYLTGELEVELLPQGTMAERVRAGGFGIPAFYTPAGYGTLVQNGGFPIKLAKDGKTPLIVEEPKEVRVFNGRPYLMEYGLKTDYALIKGWKADTKGNMVFRRSARNFNPDMAKAAHCTIAEVEEIVPAGTLDPDEIHLSGIFVDRLVQGEKYEKRIEKSIIGLHDGFSINGVKQKEQAVRLRIAKRAALEIENGMYVNLGIGIPTIVPQVMDPSIQVEWQSEIGLIGIGPYPKADQIDPDVINAGKETITTIPGTAFFSSSESFGIMRGSHLNVTMIGGMQVSKTGDLANWIIPGKKVKGMGGAMDLVTSGSKVIVLMEHCNKNGGHKILDNCTLPLTGYRVVSKVITNMGVFEFRDNDIWLTEIAKEFTLEDVKISTGTTYQVSDNLKTF